MAYRISATAAGSALSDTVTITDPGSVAGDQLGFVVFVGGNQSRTLSGVPTGFTQIATGILQGSHNGTDDGWYAYYAGTTQSATYTVTVAGGNQTTPLICFFSHSGRNTLSAPSNFTVTSDTGGNNGSFSPVTISLSGVTANAGDDLIFCALLNSGGSWVFNTVTGFTNRQTANVAPSNSDSGALNLQTKDNVSAGATGSLGSVATLSSTGADFAGIVISLPSNASPFTIKSSVVAPGLTGTTGSYTVTEAVNTNDLIVVQWIMNNVGSVSIPTITDTVSNIPYTLVGTPVFYSTASNCYGQSYVVCTAAGTPTINVTNLSANNMKILVTHITGFTGIPTVDQVAFVSNASGTSISNSITTTHNIEFVMTNTFSGSTISSTPSGWQSTSSGGGAAMAQPYWQYAAASGAVSLSATLSASAYSYNYEFSFYNGVPPISYYIDSVVYF